MKCRPALALHRHVAQLIYIVGDADAGNGVATAGKQASGKAPKTGKASTAAAKKGSGKAASKDQRGIMSFFAKK